MNDGVRTESSCAVSVRVTFGLHQLQAAHAPAQDLVAHGGEMQREEQQR